MEKVVFKTSCFRNGKIKCPETVLPGLANFWMTGQWLKPEKKGTFLFFDLITTKKYSIKIPQFALHCGANYLEFDSRRYNK